MAKLVIIFESGNELSLGMTEKQANEYEVLLNNPPQQWVVVYGPWAYEINTDAVDSVVAVKDTAEGHRSDRNT